MNKEGIIKDFEDKSRTYFEDIYINKKDPKRVNRLNEIDNILKEFDLENKDVLDAGSGPAVLYEVVVKHKGSYTAIDISPDNIKAAKIRIQGLKGFVGSIDNMHFEDDSFDFIISTGCLEYIKDINEVIEEFSRIIKKDGILIISFANKKSPSRIWNETIIKLLFKIKSSLKGISTYKRYLTTINIVNSTMQKNNFEFFSIKYINNSLFGYPFSEFQAFNIIEKKIFTTKSKFEKYSMEFIAVYKKL